MTAFKMRAPIQRIISCLSILAACGCAAPNDEKPAPSGYKGSVDPIKNSFDYASNRNAHMGEIDQRLKSEVESRNGHEARSPNSIGPFLTSRAPRILSAPTPKYPKLENGGKTQANVVIQVTITPAGNAADAVVKKSTDSRFNESALSAIKTWRFSPAIVKGVPTAFKLDIPVHFKFVGDP